jgi:hypothetical protein
LPVRKIIHFPQPDRLNGQGAPNGRVHGLVHHAHGAAPQLFGDPIATDAIHFNLV